jgi:uncharacterized phiE125 gp8 family phage protein
MYSYPYPYYADGLPYLGRVTQLQETSVIVQPTIEPVTLEELKTHLRYDGNELDSYFSSLIKTGRQMVEGYIGQSLVDKVYQTYFEDYPVYGWIRLKGPLIGVVSFDYTNDVGSYTAITGSDYVVDTNSKAPRLLPAHGVSWPGTRVYSNSVRVRWRAGFVDTSASPTQTVELIPEPLRVAVMFYAQALHEREKMDDFINIAQRLCESGDYRVDFGIA